MNIQGKGAKFLVVLHPSIHVVFLLILSRFEGRDVRQLDTFFQDVFQTLGLSALLATGRAQLKGCA